MMAIPNKLTNILHALRRLSDWVDEKFFPLPVTQQDINANRVRDIEHCAGLVSKQIDNCRSMADTYDAYDAVCDFKVIWGHSVQVNGWFDSLLLKLRNKQNEILKNL